jgi:hypothetical protein
MAALDDVLAEAGRSSRICPQPRQWNLLYKLLTKDPGKLNERRAPPPLILAAWWDTSAQEKMLRLRKQIEWASEEGALDVVYQFLRNLKEDEWFHIGD